MCADGEGGASREREREGEASREREREREWERERQRQREDEGGEEVGREGVLGARRRGYVLGAGPTTGRTETRGGGRGCWACAAT